MFALLFLWRARQEKIKAGRWFFCFMHRCINPDNYEAEVGAGFKTAPSVYRNVLGKPRPVLSGTGGEHHILYSFHMLRKASLIEFQKNFISQPKASSTDIWSSLRAALRLNLKLIFMSSAWIMVRIQGFKAWAHRRVLDRELCSPQRKLINGIVLPVGKSACNA